MTDEKDTKPTVAPVVEESQPVDVPLEQNPAHPAEEDPEQLMGDETNDPWDDETQTDWPGGVVDLPEVKS